METKDILKNIAAHTRKLNEETFNDLNAEPVDYAIWLAKPRWQLREAICLVKGLNPDAISVEDIHRYAPAEINSNFYSITEQAARENDTWASLEAWVTPEEFLKWYKKQKIALPRAFAEAITEDKKPSKDSLNPKEVTSLFKLIKALGLKYDFRVDKNNNAVGKIKSLCEQHDIAIDEDTML